MRLKSVSGWIVAGIALNLGFGCAEKVAGSEELETGGTIVAGATFKSIVDKGMLSRVVYGNGRGQVATWSGFESAAPGSSCIKIKDGERVDARDLIGGEQLIYLGNTPNNGFYYFASAGNFAKSAPTEHPVYCRYKLGKENTFGPRFGTDWSKTLKVKLSSQSCFRDRNCFAIGAEINFDADYDLAKAEQAFENQPTSAPSSSIERPETRSAGPEDCLRQSGGDPARCSSLIPR